MGHIKLTPVPSSPFRKIAMGTWRTAKDPTVYGIIEIDMLKANLFSENYSKQHNIKITPSHLVGKAAAFCLKQRPEINGMIRGSQIYLRDTVNIFFQVNVPGRGADKIKDASLSGCTVEGAENLSLADLSRKLNEKADKVRTGKDPELAKNIALFKYIPWQLTGLYLDLASWLIYGLNWNLSFLGLPKDPFGSLMITNVGSLGIDMAFAPLCAYSRVPLLLTVGAIQPKAWVVDGKIEVRPILPVTVTFDHRLIDGIHASKMAADFKKCFAEPEKYLA